MNRKCAECGAGDVQLFEMKEIMRDLWSDPTKVDGPAPGPFCAGCRKVIEEGFRQSFTPSPKQSKKAPLQ